MRKREFERFALKFLIPRLPGFVVKGNLIFAVPVGNIVRGFIFDSSGFSAEAFYPEAFVQPLYIPSDYITMTLGKRLLGVWNFRKKDDAALAEALLRSMQKEGLPLLEKFGTSDRIAMMGSKLAGAEKNHYVRQAIAYSLTWTGKDRQALARLNDLLQMLVSISSFQKWALDVHSEVVGLRELLRTDPPAARAQLARWTEETRSKLGLPA